MRRALTMGKGKKGKVIPTKEEAVTFKPPPATLNEHIDFTKGVRMEGVVDQSRLTLRPAASVDSGENKASAKEPLSEYKKKLILKNTLGWYYYLPRFMRPKPKLNVHSEDEENVPAGAIRARNKVKNENILNNFVLPTWCNSDLLKLFNV
jgi:hypothetical protein